MNTHRSDIRTRFAAVLGPALLSAALGLSPSVVAAEAATDSQHPRVTVYKSPSCGCCSKWIGHLESNGFEVTAVDMNDLGLIKSMSGIAPQQASCHTAKVGGYVVEGHVPAADIKRLLRERPDIKGLAVPGMPMGSPGMEGPRKDAYEVLGIRRDGGTDVYARH